MNDGLIH